MSIKAWLFGGLAIGITVGTATIAQDVGTAIEIGAQDRSRAANQKLRQQRKDWELNYKIEAALIDEKIALKEGTIEVLRYVVPVTLIFIIGSTMKLYYGWTTAESRKALFQATQIKMDPDTMTYPIVCFEAGGRLRLHDPNNKTTIAVDVENDAIPLLVNHSTAVQLQKLAANNQEVSLQALTLGLGD